MDVDIICNFRNKSNFIFKNFKNKKIISTHFNNKNNNFFFDDIWFHDSPSFNNYKYLKSNSLNYKEKYIIFFGYSGSGKTFTMYNLLKEIINNFLSNNISFTVSCFQIYNNTIFDLLNNNHILNFFKNDNLIIKDITKSKFNSFNDLLKIIKKFRKFNKTSNNNNSSRSSLIINIHTLLESFNIIDLHGQEIINTNYKYPPDSKIINFNMLSIKQCIISYYKKKKHIPFRNCLLTFYLKNMFKSICKVFFICSINSEHNLFQQIDTMKYSSLLIHPNKYNINNDIHNFILEYSIYIADISINNCENNDILQQISNNDFSNIHRINQIINSNNNSINFFKKKLNYFISKYNVIN